MFYMDSKYRYLLFIIIITQLPSTQTMDSVHRQWTEKDREDSVHRQWTEKDREDSVHRQWTEKMKCNVEGLYQSFNITYHLHQS